MHRQSGIKMFNPAERLALVKLRSQYSKWTVQYIGPLSSAKRRPIMKFTRCTSLLSVLIDQKMQFTCWHNGNGSGMTLALARVKIGSLRVQVSTLFNKQI